MIKLILIFLMLLTISKIAWSSAHDHGLQLDVKINGRLYDINASFDTPLTKCAAFHFLTDYEGAKKIPGVIELLANRQATNKVKVDLTADEYVMFFSVRLHSVMEYTEKKFDSVTFTQLSGDLKTFQGKWDIEPSQQGSTLRFKGVLERDTKIPLVIVDFFVKSSLINKFGAIADMAEKHKDMQENNCGD